jgi:hypothetical protein
MDITTLDTTPLAEAGVDMELRHPGNNSVIMQDDGVTPITIRVLGMDSKAFRKANRVNQDKRIKGVRYRMPTAAERDEDAIDILIKCTIGWSGIEREDGPLSCTPANVRWLYTNMDWIKRQVDDFIGDAANFLPSSETS